jgi:hypothetical protein
MKLFSMKISNELKLIWILRIPNNNSYYKLSKTTQWRKYKKNFLYHGIKRINGGKRGYIIPGIIFLDAM